MTTNFSLVLPCYNEEENISHLYDEFKKIPLVNETAELIFVNNGSIDTTEKKIDQMIKVNPKPKTLSPRCRLIASVKTSQSIPRVLSGRIFNK